ncbi:MAG TPA: family 16 glycoside hydrolase, partial [Bryobacteraceae bacterium]|nr:family 16 glycoside hydrolase [Bryobacteraceae bacterium]
MMNKYAIAALGAVGLLTLVPALAVGPTFKADDIFKGSALTGWHTLGAANWRADKGEVIGTPSQPGGGWLVFDKSIQDVGLYANFQCTGGCRTGVLFRAEKTADGMKGVFVSLNDGDVASYGVTLDSQGKE